MPEVAQRHEREPEEGERACEIRDARVAHAGAEQHALDQRRTHERPDDGREHETREVDRVVEERWLVDTERGERAADRGPVRDVLRIRQRQRNAGTPRAPRVGRRRRRFDDELLAARAPRLPREPEQVRDAGNADREAQTFEPQQNADTREAEDRPDAVADDRAELHGERGLEAAAHAGLDRGREHGTRRCVEQ
jgi:hypothetical protein